MDEKDALHSSLKIQVNDTAFSQEDTWTDPTFGRGTDCRKDLLGENSESRCQDGGSLALSRAAFRLYCTEIFRMVRRWWLLPGDGMGSVGTAACPVEIQ